MNANVAKLNGLALRACELCHRKEGTRLRCSACQSIYYCGRDCQAKDRETHKTPCKLIKKARLLYEDEDHKLRNSSNNDGFRNENYSFEMAPGPSNPVNLTSRTNATPCTHFGEALAR